jgi:uncharacterized protein (TIGR03083 family)
MDLPRMYTDAQTRVIDLVRTLSPPALATTVPGTPRWTIEQLVCHVTGVCCDMIDGRVDGAATESWTSRQVAEREHRPLPDVLAEWRSRTPEVLELLAIPGKIDATTFDLLTHEHDLRGALGLAGPSDEAAVAAVTTRVTGRVGHLANKGGLPGLRLVNDNGDWVCGSAAVGVTGTASTMEWFRALFGRRSAAQILTYVWDGDPTPYFGLLNLFGPLPPADVAEAGAPVPAG